MHTTSQGGGGVLTISLYFLECGTVISDHNVPFELEIPPILYIPPSQLEVGYTIAYDINITSITHHAH